MTLRWDDPELAVKSEDRRTFRYRLLQSWYRQEILGAQPGEYTPVGKKRRPLGSLLHSDELQFRRELNFINSDAYAHAIERIRACATTTDALHRCGRPAAPSSRTG